MVASVFVRSNTGKYVGHVCFISVLREKNVDNFPENPSASSSAVFEPLFYTDVKPSSFSGSTLIAEEFYTIHTNICV